MPKEQYREVDVARKISYVNFGIESAENMQQQAHIHIVSQNLYTEGPQRVPQPFGVLDRRLGTSSKDAPCQTCGKNLNECAGHYGYIDLELPVFHVGYFRSTIAVLQSICKRCSRVLLPEPDRSNFRKKLINPYLNYMTKKIIRKRIIDKCKKINKCPYCKDINGFVQKLTASKAASGQPVLKIIHEKFRGKKEKDPLLQEHMIKFSDAIHDNPEMQSAISSGPLLQILSPIDVLRLFERIPEEDIPLLAMTQSRAHPKDLLLTRMLVPPVCIRPSVVSELKSGTNEDDLTMSQMNIIRQNDIIRNAKICNVGMSQYQGQWDHLQITSAQYINSEISGTAFMNRKPGRGLIQRLKGKQGRFRGNLSGKRVDFSSRTVISPDPHLEVDQVGVPVHVAKILTYPERVILANIDLLKQAVRNGPDIWPGANYVQQKGSQFKKFLRYGNREKLAQDLKLGDLVERHLHDNDIVLFNRQPSLHKLSIMAHRTKIHAHRTFRFNECACNPYNADFDGDEMNLHLPQTEEAKAEALILMGNKSNLVTPRNGELLIAATQDFLTGGFLISSKNTFLDFMHASQLAAALLANDDVVMPIDLPTPAIMKPKRMWTGKQIISMVLKTSKECLVKANLESKGKAYTKNREFCVKDSYVVIRNSDLLSGTLDKGHLGSGGKANNVFYVILRDFGQEYAIRSMWRLAKMTSYYLMNKGLSIGVGDVTPGDRLLDMKHKILMNGYTTCDVYLKDMIDCKLQAQPGCTMEETLEAIVLKELSAIRELVGKACISELHPTNSPLIMVLSGSKGSTINVSQMVACVGQQALNGKRVPDGFEDRSLPHFEHHSTLPTAKGFVENSFYSGLTPTEFFFHTMGGREGLVDTAVKTAETGYMQRRLVKSLEDLVVHYDGSVRNADGDIVQLVYGCDGLDPTYMEGKDCPVDFERVLTHIKAKCPYREESALDPNQIRKATLAVLDTIVLKETSEEFRSQLKNFMDKVAKQVELSFKKYGIKPIVKEMERLTCSQLVTFLETCGRKYTRSIIEPGTAVGALAAQSIGEPGTQMTLKTFHFAGVASMNITQGVPRIREIINASKNISTPIITASLMDPHNPESARHVKNRVQRTTLGEVSSYIDTVYTKSESFILVMLDYQRIQLLELEIDIETIKYRLCTSKLKLRSQDVKIQSKIVLTISANTTKYSHRCNTNLQDLKQVLPSVVICGIPTVNRAIVASDYKCSKTVYNLCVEGNNLREVMATYGIDGNHTVSNNIMEVYATLGIEAARETIITEIKMVMENHGMSVDYRHIMLLAAQMTHTGEVLGINRNGLAKMKQSVFNLASFEKTADHLFDAAYYGQADKITGVSENIIMGMSAPIGTGIFKLLHKPNKVDETPPVLPVLFEGAWES